MLGPLRDRSGDISWGRICSLVALVVAVGAEIRGNLSTGNLAIWAGLALGNYGVTKYGDMQGGPDGSDQDRAPGPQIADDVVKFARIWRINIMTVIIAIITFGAGIWVGGKWPNSAPVRLLVKITSRTQEPINTNPGGTE